LGIEKAWFEVKNVYFYLINRITLKSMDQIRRRKLIWGIPLFTLFLSGGFLAFARTDLGAAPIPANVYWISLLKGFLLSIFIIIINPILIKNTLGGNKPSQKG